VGDKYLNTDARERAWEVYTRISKLTVTELCASGARRGPYDKTPYYRLDDAALEEFVHWREGLERWLRSHELSPALEGHFAKYRKLVPALTLINHLADNGGGSIGLVALRKAIAFSKYLESHARRIYSAADTVEIDAAKAILTQIRKGELTSGFTARDVHQHRWSNLTEHSAVRDGLDLLVDLDYLMAQHAVVNQFGGRPKTVYMINPAVFR
jgi:hypothetical protein